MYSRRHGTGKNINKVQSRKQKPSVHTYALLFLSLLLLLLYLYLFLELSLKVPHKVYFAAGNVRLLLPRRDLRGEALPQHLHSRVGVGVRVRVRVCESGAEHDAGRHAGRD